MRKRILLLSSLTPLPARANGFSVRYAPILAELATTHDLDLALVQDVPKSSVAMGPLEHLFRKVAVHVRSHRKQPLLKRVTTRILTLFPGMPAYPLVVYDAHEINAFLREEFGALHYDLLLVTSPELIDQCLSAIHATRVVIDAIDSMTLLSQRSEHRT